MYVYVDVTVWKAFVSSSTVVGKAAKQGHPESSWLFARRFADASRKEDGQSVRILASGWT